MSFCKRVGTKVRSILRKVEKAVLDNAAIALSITKALQAFMDTGIVDMAVLITKTKADDALLVHAKRALLVSIDTLELVEKCKNAATDQLKIQCFVEGLMELSPALRESVLIKLASLITGELSGNMDRRSFYDAVTQALYTAEK
jgi:hypothetical protein